MNENRAMLLKKTKKELIKEILALRFEIEEQRNEIDEAGANRESNITENELQGILNKLELKENKLDRISEAIKTGVAIMHPNASMYKAPGNTGNEPMTLSYLRHLFSLSI